jgi:hypothetical protein
MSNYFPLLGVAVCIGIAALPAVFNLIGGAHDEHVYKYSRGFRVFLWVGSLCLLFSGIVFKILGTNAGPSTMQLALLTLIGITAVIGCVYTDKYHISLNTDLVEFGAFRSTSIHYNEITALRRIPGRTPILEIHTRDRAYSLSGNVQDFGKLCELLEKSCGKKFN